MECLSGWPKRWRQKVEAKRRRAGNAGNYRRRGRCPDIGWCAVWTDLHRKSGWVNKAYTCAAFSDVHCGAGRAARPGEPLYGIQHTNGGRIVIFGGGEPLVYNGKIIGALGVSGGTAEQDTSLAAYGASLLKEVISCL